MKICSKCKEIRNLDLFNKNKNSKDGYAFYCKPCKANADKKYYGANIVDIKKKVNDYRNKNFSNIKQKKKLYYQNNKEYVIGKSANYYHANKDRILTNQALKLASNPEEYKKIYLNIKIKRKSDPSLKAIMNVRQRVCQFLKGKNRYLKTLGCTKEELKTHIESKFLPGMTWDNYGVKGWHIDHIYPLSKAYKNGPDSFKKACHYSNLQPLWAIDNIRKSDSYDIYD